MRVHIITRFVFQGLAAILFCLIQQVSSQECGADGTCDSHERCPSWKDEGECYRDPSYMKQYCPVACTDMKPVPRRNIDCIDTHTNCSFWAEDTECETNQSVKKYCPLSCGVGKCGDNNTTNNDKNKDVPNTGKNEQVLCTDDHENCGGWADMGECEDNPKYMRESCKKSCGVCRSAATATASKTKTTTDPIEDMLKRTAKFGEIQVASGDKQEITLDNVREMIDYMEKSDDFLTLSSEIQDNCRTKNELCSFWAAIGECEANVAFMKIQCAPACKTCHLIDMANRCPELPDSVPALGPGDLNKMFERIVERAPGNRTLSDEERQRLAKSEMTEYSVKVYSRPSDESATEVNIESDKKLPPWVITLDNFLTDEETDALIQHGYDEGYKRSEDVGAEKFDGTVDSRQSTGRTSENAWCTTRSGCREKPMPTRILNRISTVMGIPPENSEDFQILKYDVGQFYKTHHDYIPHQKSRQCGPRILTFFLYLSDVEEGGGTDFPDLGITVQPKKGRALIWPSIMDADPMEIDGRMRHQALPVEKGLKFGANSWIHMFDYQAPQKTGCN